MTDELTPEQIAAAAEAEAAAKANALKAEQEAAKVAAPVENPYGIEYTQQELLAALKPFKIQGK
jgi:hypothetical protein